MNPKNVCIVEMNGEMFAFESYELAKEFLRECFKGGEFTIARDVPLIKEEEYYD